VCWSRHLIINSADKSRFADFFESTTAGTYCCVIIVRFIWGDRSTSRKRSVSGSRIPRRCAPVDKQILSHEGLCFFNHHPTRNICVPYEEQSKLFYLCGDPIFFDLSSTEIESFHLNSVQSRGMSVTAKEDMCIVDFPGDGTLSEIV